MGLLLGEVVGALCQGGFAGGGRPLQFDKGHVFHLMEPDVNQELYGVPQYLSALQSAWLNEAATLFRRKYYKNGSHAGFVFYMMDAAANTQDVDNLRQAMRDSKGPGNYLGSVQKAVSLFPGGSEQGAFALLPLRGSSARRGRAFVVLISFSTEPACNDGQRISSCPNDGPEVVRIFRTVN